MKRFLIYLEASVLPFLVAESILLVLATIIGILNEQFLGLSKATYLFSIIAVAIWGVIFFFWYRHDSKYEDRGSVREIFRIKNLIHFIFLGIGCQFFFSGAMSLLQHSFERAFDQYGHVVESILNENILFVLLYTAAIAPIAEELVFRGLILHKARRTVSFWGANILQAVFFGLYHQNMIQGIYATVIGLLLGLVYRKYNTISAPIVLHILINASAFIIMAVPMSTLSYAAMLVGGALFVIIAVSGLGLLKTKKLT